MKFLPSIAFVLSIQTLILVQDCWWGSWRPKDYGINGFPLSGTPNYSVSFWPAAPSPAGGAP